MCIRDRSRELRALLEDGLVRLCAHNAPAPEIISFREQDRVDTWPWADFGPLERRDCTDDELYWQVCARSLIHISRQR